MDCNGTNVLAPLFLKYGRSERCFGRTLPVLLPGGQLCRPSAASVGADWGGLLFTLSWNMNGVRRPSSTPSQNRRWNMWLDRFTGIDESIEGLSGDDVPTP